MTSQLQPLTQAMQQHARPACALSHPNLQRPLQHGPKPHGGAQRTQPKPTLSLLSDSPKLRYQASRPTNPIQLP